MTTKDAPYDWSNIDPRVRTSIMLGLALGMLMACLDGTVVSTSITAILVDLDGYDLYSWVFTGYMLCETIMIPISGKLSDLYGRKKLFLIGIAFFIVFSVLAGMATSMEEFIVFRSLQGIGGGTLIPVAMATVADLYAPEKRGRVQGELGALFAVATCLGPFLGGYITDSMSWHWVFYINVPISALAVIMTLRKFPSQVAAPDTHIDYVGMAVLAAMLADLLLFFSFVGQDFDWVSVETAVMMVVFVVLLALFVLIELRAKDPVLSMRLFRQRTFIICSLIIFIFGMALMGTMSYMPVFMQNVMGFSASNTGEIMVPMVVGMTITSLLSGFLLDKTGYKVWMIVGAIVSAIGMYLMSTLDGSDSHTSAIIYLFVTGAGMGCVMSVVMVAAQNDAKRDEVGMTTSGVNLFRSVGSTIAVGVFTTIINNQMAEELMEVLPQVVYDSLPSHGMSIMNSLPYLPAAVASQVIVAYGESVTYAFFLSAFVALIVAFIAPFLKNNKPTHMAEDATQELNAKLAADSSGESALTSQDGPGEGERPRRGFGKTLYRTEGWVTA